VPPARLRLTRRGRVVLVVLPALLALSGALLAAAPGAAEAAPQRTARTVVVGTGDTLWTIAERIAPDTDPRTTVAAIERANGLSGAHLDAGAVLVLPAGR
jgi:nucleoid-associated protein YgaU